MGSAQQPQPTRRYCRFFRIKFFRASSGVAWASARRGQSADTPLHVLHVEWGSRSRWKSQEEMQYRAERMARPASNRPLTCLSLQRAARPRALSFSLAGVWERGGDARVVSPPLQLGE